MNKEHRGASDKLDVVNKALWGRGSTNPDNDSRMIEFIKLSNGESWSEALVASSQTTVEDRLKDIMRITTSRWMSSGCAGDIIDGSR